MKINNLFLTEILPWYKKHGRKLPWRKARISAYEVWVSEVMLQQTQVSRVMVYYARFLKKFPTVEHLASASWEEFLPYYEGLGYYARGRNMLATAKIVAKKYHGEFPREKKLLVELPGIGEYTASAILSFTYGEPEVAFDTNFKKIFKTRERAEKVFRDSGVSSRIFNNAVMDWGSVSRRTTPPAKGEMGEAPRGLVAIRPLRPAGTSPWQGRRKPILTIVILHENHKKYYSLNKKKYESFKMPEGVVTREEIKKYFLEEYKLKISIRPPHKKEIINGKMNIFINAQILLGKHQFREYKRT
ncbi:hypothetical protein L0Y69_00255 [bacterium]|nr:hypothetical protein [bacterium]